MNVIFVKDYDEMSEKTYELIAQVVKENEEPIVGLTTGGTPRGLMKLLVERVNANELDLSNTSIVNLDEYIGPRDAVYSSRTYMYDNLYNKIETKPKNIFIPDGSVEDLDAEIKRYNDILAQYPTHIQICGLGINGHIGANEPGTPFDSTTFIAKFEEITIETTMKEYGVSREDCPTEMLTAGFKEILESKHVVVMVSGSHKAEAVKAVLEGPVTTDWPVTNFKDKDNVTFIIDEEAASLLSKHVMEIKKYH